ncbi:hypothetical protein DSCA_00400 [Desulfosarcina alkanivorans]|uniref:Uncharacterized protein n=1 Tax=Desulfosarcina alkanivorans TaxID=571177 RepID=A0A5K7YDQ7_9BACT|nr:hypothetical protein [Desulfosarcina alkanivorans]BBO66110.1 hypothetical protein DSCA_00400 [Desulfosarcina alkanivorans]
MPTRESFIESLKENVAVWKAEVERLQVNADRIDNKEMGHYSATIKEIIAKIQQVENQFTVEGISRSDTWQALRKRSEAAGSDIELLINQAAQRFLPDID